MVIKRGSCSSTCMQKAHCSTCTLGYSGGFGNLVPGKTISPEQPVVHFIVGEAPGREEVPAQEPFVGAAGKLLRHTLEGLGMLQNSHLTNACLCHPPNNRTPTTKELAACRDRLLCEIAETTPEIIWAVGAAAFKTLFPKDKYSTVEDLVGHSYDLVVGDSTYPTVFIHHPAYILRNSSFAPLWYELWVKQTKAARGLLRKPAPTSLLVVDTSDQAIGLFSLLADSAVCLDLETTSTDPRTCRLLCMALAWKNLEGKHAAAVIPAEILQQEPVKDELKRFLQSKQFVGQNLHFDSMVLLHKFGPDYYIAPELDTLLAAQVMYPRTKGHKLETLLLVHLDYQNYKFTFREALEGDFGTADEDLLYRYAANDACCTLELAEYYSTIMDKAARTASKMMRVIDSSVQQIEYRGIRVDTEYATKLKSTLYEEALQIQAQIEEVTSGEITNPRSTPQVRNHLYKTLNLKTKQKTNTGLPSTGKEAMDALTERAPVAALIKQYRSNMSVIADHIDGTLKFTYLDARGDCILNPKYRLDTAITGRLASEHPNTQNYPPRCRGIFIPRDDHVFVEADFKQLEVRVGLVLAKDAAGLQMAQSETSIHIQTTTRIFGPNYTKDQYRLCKSVVFEIMYGGDEPGAVASKLQISKKEARSIIKLVHEVVAGYIRWREIIRQRVRDGKPPYITPFGRHRDFPIINKTNYKDVMNECINFPVQSTASDVCQLLVARAFAVMGCFAVNTTHDSLLSEFPERNWQEYAQQLKRVLESPVRLLGETVSFPVDVSVGKRWGELKEIVV